jgi:uncharacterized protein YciI
MVNVKKQPVYYAVIVVTKYKNFDEAKMKEPDAIMSHIARSKQLHEDGVLLMSGAFLDDQGPLSTMGILTSREAAEEYIKNDPFMLNGMIAQYYIRPWANMFA